jgi:hypothetical protein
LRVDLPLHFVPFGLRKGELGNDRIGLINGARRRGTRARLSPSKIRCAQRCHTMFPSGASRRKSLAR